MKTWEIEVDGEKHIIKYEVEINKIIVDGNINFLKSQKLLLNVIDYEFKIGNTICNLVVINREARLAINGIYVDQNEPYVPIATSVKLANILSVISLIGGIILFGVIPASVGAIMIHFYLKFAVEKKYGLVICCFIVCIILEIIISIIIALIIELIKFELGLV